MKQRSLLPFSAIISIRAGRIKNDLLQRIRRGIDSARETRYNTHMETLYRIISETIGNWSGEVLGRPLSARLSETALLASSGLVKGGAKEAAAELGGRIGECEVLGTRLLKGVSEKNGWILFDLASSAFDAYALSLPALLPGQVINGADFVDFRMDMLLRHPDGPIPDREPVLRAVLTASHASDRGRWTPQDERTVLCMTHGMESFDRVRTEQACARAARIILCERMAMRREIRSDTMTEGVTK